MIHFTDAFLKQAEQNPDSTAVLDRHGSYSYGELNRRSAYLAEQILNTAEPYHANERIALLMSRTKDFVTAWLAVFRAGCAAIPLSDEYPAERIAAIMKDAGCRRCITVSKLTDRLPEEAAFIAVDEVLPSDKEVPPCDLSLNLSHPDAEGLLFYTSGSTGSPKGVIHRLSILDAYPHLLPQVISITSSTRTLCIAMFPFAASLIDLTPPLYYGGSIYIADEEERKDTDTLYSIMKEQHISGVFMPPAMYGIMRQLYGVLPLEYMFVSGEKALPKYMFSDPGIYELYGASECPPMLINPLGKDGPKMLGFPYEGVTAFLKDEGGNRITDPDIIGELCIISPYTATGYHNLPEETAEKFESRPGQETVYHTGDYMAYSAKGSLVFHGRKDRMVKIRGQRAELGEIDHVITECEGITEARTVAVTIGSAERIACFYTGKKYDRNELRQHAEKYLAPYMIPDFFLHLPAMPRNARNKTDYLALKDMAVTFEEERRAKAEQRTDAEGSAAEQKISSVFAEVLGLPSFNPRDSFFDLGGTSILAMEAAAKLRDLNISFRDLFTLKTPGRLAEFLQEQTTEPKEETASEAGEENREYPLLPYQRYYVDYQLYTPKGDGSNVPVLKAIPRTEIDPFRLKEAVDRVQRHFCIFGMVFTFAEDGSFVQRYEPERIQPVEIVETTEEAFEKEIPHLIRSHRVINSLLYRTGIYVTETTVYLFMDFHHSIIDGAGLDLVIQNIIRVLNGQTPDKDLYFEFLRQYEQNISRKEMQEETEKLKKIYNLPSYARYPKKDHESRENRIDILTIPFDYSLSDLMGWLSEKNMSLGMVYSAAGLLSMKEQTGFDQVQVQWIFSGRDEVWKQNVVGITMSAHPLAIDFSRKDLDLLKEVSDQIIESIIYSDLSFALYDNSPNKQESVNMICEDGIEINTSITPGTKTIPMWDYRLTAAAAAECVLYPLKKENRLLMFINYNSYCYEKETMERFGASVAENMRRLARE